MSFFQSDLDSIFLGFLLTFSKSIPQNLSTFSFLTNPFFILTRCLLSQSRASSFRYLGILFSSSLSWCPHISFLCHKSRKILGLRFRHFSPHSSPSTNIGLYIYLIRLFWNTIALFGTLRHLLFFTFLNLSIYFAPKIASRFRPSSSLLFNLNSISPP